MITDISDFFARGCGRCQRFDTAACSTRRWSDGLAALRALCLEVGLNETLKWGQPCYVHAGRNIVILGALKDDFRLSFFEAALTKDPESVFQSAGPNTLDASILAFTSVEAVHAYKAVISAYLRKAMDYAERGTKAPPKQLGGLELPAELQEALEADPALAQAFNALTPGRQRSYTINLSSAQQSATRCARIEKFRPRIMAGRGAQEYAAPAKKRST